MSRLLPWLLIGAGYYLLRKDDDVATTLESTVLAWPVALLDDSGKRVGRGTSRITQEYRPPTHMGVDIAVPGHYKDARADVLALAAGKVAGAYQFERGWAVLLDHGDWASGYLHMTELDPAIRDGQLVQSGQRLGPMGADPSDPEGVVHLHLQIAPGGHTTDPAPYLARAV